MTVSEDLFRKTLGLFPTGVTVVTASHAHQDMGITISSFSSVSLHPPQVLFCLSNHSKAMPILESTPYFAINILTQRQSSLSDIFAHRSPLKWEEIKTWRHLETKCLLLSEALGHILCKKITLYEGGDHKIILGQVIDLLHASEELPLIRQRGQYLTTKELSFHE